MKKMIMFVMMLLMGVTLVTAGMNIPEPTGYVVDTINIITPSTKDAIELTCKNLDSIAQVAVLTVSSTYPYSIEEYSIKVAEKWKVGYVGKDNGVILIVVKNDRKVRIEVGRGVEDKITDATAGRIIANDIIPYFKNGNFSEGIAKGIYAIRKELVK